MTTAHIMQQLESLGSDQAKKILMRHGAREPFFGVKVGDMKGIVKNVKSVKSVKSVKNVKNEKNENSGEGVVDSHELALELYATRNSDAMYLAGLLADPKRMEKETLQAWVDAAYWHMLSDYTIAWVTSESRFGWELGLEWIRSGRELTASAGWSTLGAIVSITPDNQLDINKLKELAHQVEKTMATAQNRVKYSMNNFLIAVASYVPELTALGKSIGASVGTVTVDMGGTACKVPYAPDYISKVENMGRIGQKRKTAFC